MKKNDELVRMFFKTFRHSKALKIMKFSTLFLIITALQVLAVDSYSQATRLSMGYELVPVEQVLKDIEDNSEFYFLFNQELVDVSRQVEAKFRNQKIDNILAQIFAGTDVDFLVMDRQIILSPSEYLAETKLQMQPRTITGLLTDEAGEPLIGATVIIKGTTIGSITDMQGNYSLEVPEGAILVFSYIGMTSQEVPVGSNTTMNISLVEDIMSLEEVVVVGYGTMQKKEITGAVTTVKTEFLPKTATYSVEGMLQGRVAGLNMELRSAQPGGSSDINIRGSISPRGNNSPLIVIDGVPVTNNSSAEPDLTLSGDIGWHNAIDRSPLSMINPSDIVSVDVLKDASATAIYGSSAANGIIMITTKKGQAGQVKVNYRGVYTVQTPKEYYPLLDANGFMEQNTRMSYEEYLYDNSLPPYGTNDPASAPTFTPLFSPSDISSNTIDNDWVDMVTQNGYINEHNLSLNGGTQATRFFASFGFLDQESLVKANDYRRYTGRVNLDQKIGERLNLSVNMSMSRVSSSNASYGPQDGGIEKWSMLMSARQFAPVTPIYDADGSYAKTYNTQATNPLAYLEIDDNMRTSRFMVNPKLDIDIIAGLKLTVRGGADLSQSKRKMFLPVSVENFQTPDGMSSLYESSISNYTGETFFTFSREFGDSRITAVAGTGIYKVETEGFGLSTQGFFTDAMGYNNIGIASEIASNQQTSYYTERYKVSQFFRANYTLLDKYTLSFVGRRDGSSIFSENNKYGFFPGISAAWRIAQESFMSSATVVSDLKLRVGYGTSGNESVLSGNTLQLYGNSSNLVWGGYEYLIGNTYFPGIGLRQIANPDLTWETNISMNAGLDFAFFANRITGSFDIFRKTTEDLLDFSALPSNNPVTRIADNIGSTRSDGFEVALRTINIQTGDIRWETGLTLAHYYAYWVERNPQVNIAEWIEEDGGMRDSYGWETDGIVQTTADIPSYMPNAYLGNVIYVDQNGDGALDELDVVKLYNSDPRLTFGFDNTFSYKGLDLNVYMYGLMGKNMGYGYNPSTGAISPTGDPRNTLTTIKDVWTHDNPTGTLPGLAANLYGSSNPAGGTDFNRTDVYFVRIKNITMGYNLSSIPAVRNILSNMRVFVELQNVYLITNYEGFDPELSTSGAAFPQAFSTSFGVDVTF
jgi:TonB-dependent starch-binding outer membrane protein SusC